MTHRRIQALVMFVAMVTLASSIGGADVVRAMIGLCFVLGIMLLIYYVILGITGGS